MPLASAWKPDSTPRTHTKGRSMCVSMLRGQWTRSVVRYGPDARDMLRVARDSKGPASCMSHDLFRPIFCGLRHPVLAPRVMALNVKILHRGPSANRTGVQRIGGRESP